MPRSRATAAGDLGDERRAQPADRVRADGKERDIAEVEQAGKADDHVQAEGHDGVAEREDAHAGEAAERAEGERQQRRGTQQHSYARTRPAHRPPVRRRR
jgi:hypothetical protein